MLSRPGRNESEEDLLRFQTEFLAQCSTPSANVSRVTPRQCPSSVTESNPPLTSTAGPNHEDVLCEKRHHERDVVHLQGLNYSFS